MKLIRSYNIYKHLTTETLVLDHPQLLHALARFVLLSLCIL